MKLKLAVTALTAFLLLTFAASTLMLATAALADDSGDGTGGGSGETGSDGTGGGSGQSGDDGGTGGGAGTR